MRFAQMTLASRFSSRLCGLVLSVTVVLLQILVVEASVPCHIHEDCRGLLNHAAGASINPQAPPSLSECGADGVCTNPYQNGCLINRLPGWAKLRICNSEDPDNAAELGLCSPQVGWDHMEIRIHSRNWESVFFEAWILQILLSEMLNVPTTIETGVAGKSVNLYDPATRMDYGSNDIWTSLERAYEVGDCRKGLKTDVDDYYPCAHVITEFWSGDRGKIIDFEERKITEPHTFMGIVGFETWFIPKFTGERDPTLLTYPGLAGEANRRKLAERFKRPTTWQDYCDLVAIDHCLTDDGVAKRAPMDESEYDHMFVEGVYTGYFRTTEENDCDKWPHNCTGHIADFPCGWTSYVLPQTYHLDIALASSGKEPGSRGYSYMQLVEIWLAGNATQSDVMMPWWMPEALYTVCLGTGAEFQPVGLPWASRECMENRIDPLKVRCGDYTMEEKVGNPLGACGKPPIPLMKVVSSGLYTETYDPAMPKARVSPGYDAVSNFRIDAFHLGDIFDYWLHAGFDKWNLDGRDATCRWAVENFDELQQFVPPTYPRVLQENKDSYTNPFATTLFVLGGVVTALVVACAALTFQQKSRRVMVYAQVEFMFLLLAGVLLVSIASMIHALPPTNIRCVALIWLINLGYTLELVPLIVKIGAINRLMQAARRMKRVVLPRKQLFRAVTLLVSIVCALLILWTVLDSPHGQAFYTVTESKTEYGETIVLLDRLCASERFRDGWQFTSFSAQCFLLLVASVLAFQTRNLSKGLNEAHTLATLIYSHFVFVGCRFLIFIFEKSLGAVVASRIFSLLYSLDSIATLVIYFLPKFMAGENDDFVQRYYGHAASVVRAPNPSGRLDKIHQSGSNLAGINTEAEPSATKHNLVSTISIPGLPDDDLLSPCQRNQTGSTDGAIPESEDEEVLFLEKEVDIPNPTPSHRVLMTGVCQVCHLKIDDNDNEEMMSSSEHSNLPNKCRKRGRDAKSTTRPRGRNMEDRCLPIGVSDPTIGKAFPVHHE